MHVRVSADHAVSEQARGHWSLTRHYASPTRDWCVWCVHEEGSVNLSSSREDETIFPSTRFHYVLRLYRYT
jgi:hypothetical protein